MYIKSLVLDGFKSYGQRTEITGFDKQFNAITGYNGSGKSNILDSICFVLGISNLSSVRAGSLQDLIYGNGQAGVMKATVSITFDNNNPEQSPPGFEQFNEITVTRQVVMGGKNKYLLNGSVVQNKRIQDLFCSVQLNVNNPHFLIMQGRVTKVLNMKPPEILAMIEEAAGTRMYENKRQDAEKIITKKDAKLSQLNTVVKEDIGPILEKLKEERSAFLEYQRIERELDRMTRLHNVWKYQMTKKQHVLSEQALEEGQLKMQELHDHIKSNRKEAKDLEQEVEEMTKELQSANRENLHSIEAELKEKEKIEAKANAAEKSAKEAITSEEKKNQQLVKNISEDEQALRTKEQELQKVQDLFKKLKDTEADDKEAFEIAQRKYEAISVGMEVNDAGETETLQDQLMAAKQQAAEVDTEAKQSVMKLQHYQIQLKEKQKDLGSNTAEYEKDKRNLDIVQQEVQKLEKALGKINYSEEKMMRFQTHRQGLKNEIRTLQEKVERFQVHNQYTNFQYRDPETNFNRRNVHGVVCRLFKLKDRQNAIAMETAAGGKLYNVVVDTDITSKKLLQRGNLQNRTTFIPLNKIQGGQIDQKIIKLAQDLVGKENVQPALSLITYDKQLQPAMEFVYGNVFICKDLNVARQVTFHDRIRRRCVTLEGDVTDPSGTLSGGARHKGASVLIQLEDIKKDEESLKEKEQELHQLENEIRQMAVSQEQWSSTKQTFELRQHELHLLTQRLQQTTHHQQQEEVNQIKHFIEEFTNKIKTCKETGDECKRKIKDLELKMKDTKGHRESMLKAAEEQMKHLKKKADNSSKNWKQREQEYETLTLEINELKNGLVTIKEHLEKGLAQVNTLTEQYQVIQKEAAEKKEIVFELQKKVKAEKGLISEQNKDIHKKVAKKEKLLTEISEIELEIQKKDHEIKKLQEDFKTSTNRQAEYAKKVERDYDQFCKDAEELTDDAAKELEKRIRSSLEKRNKLGRNVNCKAHTVFEQEEREYARLLKRKGIVESDKSKLIAVMADLDQKKQETLMLAWEQVSKDFGSIFGTLLPNSNAKLVPIYAKKNNVLEGLEVKIFLGGVWKQNLGELSGGQKSLVALSLILAMLLFKPAPLYILDEIDAALDMSHTQNIGNMLKTHFKQSQFLIVSLKDGMFSNANVLFRTKFVDGVSTISKSTN